ncbi:hypothetical protein M011DRAFT_456482 [Sporormia fimetaria CBS 119925]|uniref:Centrosomin N-terminal motif 1 domain-containing protein n=1 Tax=Sporormia fimetaria CBS 119925 TaxID=1340428 RepID=A0A6A6VGK8_9PLEO|nr:hypothetical protein M011DRAFT_456482 [Sporormia fimetaria CBS 119925]
MALPTSTQRPGRPETPLEPRSEFLRNVLDARRAKDDPSARSGVPITPPIASSNDPWVEHALSEDTMSRSGSGRRGRRPSEATSTRGTPKRDQHVESEALKTKMFNMSLQNQLLKEQNNKLKDDLEQARHRLEQLEPLEDINVDLKETNERLNLQIQGMEEELLELDTRNRDILQIQDEAVENMERQRLALEEAADIILGLDKEKVAFQEELLKLKTELSQTKAQPAGSESRHDPRALAEDIDGSRPSTSQFGSDYYSQSSSPQAKVQPSKDGLSFKERANNLMAASLKSQKSLRDVRNRLSNASMQSLSMQNLSMLSTPPPPVLKIPDSQHNTPPSTAQPSSQSSARRPALRKPIPPFVRPKRRGSTSYIVVDCTGTGASPPPRSPPMLPTPARERNFLFNPAEDEEAFLKKAKGFLSPKRRG